MPDDIRKSIKDTYDATLAKLQEVLFSQKASRQEKKIARQSLNDLTAAMLVHNLDTVTARTALLSALIVELQDITAGIKTQSPIAPLAGDLTGLLGQAKALFSKEKKNLI